MKSSKLAAILARIDRQRNQQKQSEIITSSSDHNGNIHIFTENIQTNQDEIDSSITQWEGEGNVIFTKEQRRDNVPTSGELNERFDKRFNRGTELQTRLPTAGFGEIQLNDSQREAKRRIIAGESICLIGKAGTGKTTSVRETVKGLIQSMRIPQIKNTDGHKYLKIGFAGVVCCAFTNRATNNIAKGFDLAETPIHFITVHKLLEYYKEEYVFTDPKTMEGKKSFRFVPRRDRFNPLPSGIKLIILEESSQINKQDLHAKLLDACYGRDIQFVYLGDLQQLPPIGGDGILGYKINELPCIELRQIYRQAAKNPIIKLAWDIASGRKLGRSELLNDYSPTKDLTAAIQIRFWEQKLDWDQANIVMGKFFCDQIDKEIFNWDRGDIILMPYNKQFGTIELNKRIAEHLSSKRGSPTHEIIAGFQRHYYSVGDKVLYQKKEGIVRRIVRNGNYIGRSPLPPSLELSRDGIYQSKGAGQGNQAIDVNNDGEHMSEEELNAYLHQMQQADAEVQNQASHVMEIELIDEQFADGSTETEISTRGEFSECELAYAISIHKSQGSEWRKVFLILHHSHHQLSREMLYTAVTRASQQLFIIAESDSFLRAVKSQRIPGDTLEQKREWFRQKMEVKQPEEQEK